MNPEGQWRKISTGQFQFYSPGYAVYGSVSLSEERPGEWYWEARTMYKSRINGEKPNGYEITLERAKSMVEEHLFKTKTCEFNVILAS